MEEKRDIVKMDAYNTNINIPQLHNPIISVDAISSMKSVLRSVSSVILQAADFSNRIREIMQPIISVTANLSKMISEAIPTNFMKGFSEAIKHIYENPDSVLNYNEYEKQLDNFHWAWPYEISTEEMKTLIETVDNEKEFDAYLLGFFNSERTSKIIHEIEEFIPSHHRVLFRQITHSYFNKDYTIANNALLTILDNLLGDYLFNKGLTKRKGILNPIVDFIADIDIGYSIFTFRIMMLSHNIDFIFQDYQFNSPVVLETNKQARRHTALHGIKYSNKHADTLMLLNTMYELLQWKSELKLFNNTLVINKKTKNFEMNTESRKKVFQSIVSTKIIDCLNISKELNGTGLSRKELIEMLIIQLPNYKDCICPKTITNTLQRMRKNNEVMCLREHGTSKWVIRKVK